MRKLLKLTLHLTLWSHLFNSVKVVHSGFWAKIFPIAMSSFHFSSMCLGLSLSANVKPQNVERGTTWPLGITIFAIMAGPTPMLGPRYLLNTTLLPGNRAGILRNITHSYHPNSLIWLMSALSPFIIASGVSSSRTHMSYTVQEWIRASSSRQ